MQSVPPNSKPGAMKVLHVKEITFTIYIYKQKIQLILLIGSWDYLTYIKYYK